MLGPFATASRRTPPVVPNFVKIGQSVAKILTFSIFQDGGRPPSWICLGHIWTTNSEYFGVSITLQNLVMIDAVVFISRLRIDVNDNDDDDDDDNDNDNDNA